MFTLIFVAGLDCATLDNQGVGREQRHHLVGLSVGERPVKLSCCGSDRGRVGCGWFAAGNASYEDERCAREENYGGGV